MIPIPKPPERKKRKEKEIVFPDPEKHQQKIELYNEIRQTLLALRDSIAQPQVKDTILKFVDCIIPGSGDVTRLPYVALDGKSKQPNKVKCLYAWISRLMLAYWNYCEGDETENYQTEIEAHLLGLKGIVRRGLNTFRVVGNPVNGYSLGWG